MPRDSARFWASGSLTALSEALWRESLEWLKKRPRASDWARRLPPIGKDVFMQLFRQKTAEVFPLRQNGDNPRFQGKQYPDIYIYFMRDARQKLQGERRNNNEET